ncbi:MAG TPA: MATE family efflux transporter [Thermoanaerobaculia bacterium]|nr:MATE family efflux transporter [Thermoanaerobaculia bacterium]
MGTFGDSGNGGHQGVGSGEGLRRRFLRLTGVNILTNLTVPVAGLVDTALLGHLPDIRFLAGTALASLVFDYVYWSFGFLRMGTTGTTAQAVGAHRAGRGDASEVYRVLWRSLAVALAAGAVLLVFQVPLRELGFLLLAGESGVEAAGRDYFGARIWAAPATLANFALLGWFLGREESGRALAMSATANVVNVGLNWWFIVELGMAARGAGLATAGSQYAQLTVALVLLSRAVAGDRAPGETATGEAEAAHGGRLPGWDRLVLARERFTELARLNRDILVRTLCLVSAFALFTNFSSLLGTTVLAANAVLLRLFYVATYAVDGAAFATESLAGIFYGGGDGGSPRGADSVGALRRLERMAVAFGVVFSVGFLAVLFAAPAAVLGLLTSHAEVVAQARRGAPWLVPVLLAGAVAFVYDGFFLGLTNGRVLRNSMLLSTLVVFLPASALALALGSNHGLWLAMTLFMAARAATLAVASRRWVPAWRLGPGRPAARR